MIYTVACFSLAFLLGILTSRLYLRYRVGRQIHSAISKSAIAGRQVESFTARINRDTEDAIMDFAELLQNINASSIQTTTEIVSAIKVKMAMAAESGGVSATGKQTRMPTHDDLKMVQTRYRAMLDEVMEQLNLTVQRKSEDIGKLDHIHNSVSRIRPVSQQISGIAFSTKVLALNAAIEAARAGRQGACFEVVANEVRNLADKATASATSIDRDVNELIDYIEKAIDEVKEAMELETHFINSTVTLLQDVLLSVVDSFIKLSEVTQKNLADSSKFRDDVNHIVTKLQFEDICRQMSKNTVKLIESIHNDLKNVHLKLNSIDSQPNFNMMSKAAGFFTMIGGITIARDAMKMVPPSTVADVQNAAPPPDATDTPGRPSHIPATASDIPDAEVTFFGSDEEPSRSADDFEESNTGSPLTSMPSIGGIPEVPPEQTPYRAAPAKSNRRVTLQEDEDVTFFE